MFADVLRELRTKKGLSQEELGNKIGVKKSTISMWENGAREPSLEILEAIADTFNVDMNTLTDSKVSSELTSELQEYIEELKNREEMRMLFSSAKDASKEDIMQVVKIMNVLKDVQ